MRVCHVLSSLLSPNEEAGAALRPAIGARTISTRSGVITRSVMANLGAAAALAAIGLLVLPDSAEKDLPVAAVGHDGPTAPAPFLRVSTRGMVSIPAGQFSMGSSARDLPDARPIHKVRLGRFRLDVRPVTNRQFTAFIATTRYVTTAEQKRKSWVFDRVDRRWSEVNLANWRQPLGPDSSIAGRDSYPVVQVSWIDAAAYSKWANKRLPTEAEYEYAARAGLADADFTWGRKELPDGRYQANYWQGRFPHKDIGYDGFRGLAPAGSFPRNGFGLFDMAGNVWCWCGDWYQETYYARSPAENPRGPDRGVDHVLRGGSWLSAKNFRFGIRTAARSHEKPEYSSNHVGFRCAADL